MGASLRTSPVRPSEQAAIKVKVYRERTWQELPVTDLLPGDILSLCKGEGDLTVPCDALLLRGASVLGRGLGVGGERGSDLMVGSDEDIGAVAEGRACVAILCHQSRLGSRAEERREAGAVLGPVPYTRSGFLRLTGPAGVTGSMVVNEAALTGESVPQMKEAASADGAARLVPLDVEKAHRVHMLYGGTTIMQVCVRACVKACVCVCGACEAPC